MNLVQVVADGSPGGGTTMVLGLIDDLIASRGWRPAVVSQPGSYLERETVRRGLRFVPFDFFGPMVDPVLPVRFAMAMRGSGRPLAHVHGLRAAHHVLSWPARTALGPVVYTVHGLHQLYMPWPRALKALVNLAERRVTRRADRTVYVSQGDRRLAEANRLVVDPSRAEVVLGGISLADLPPRPAGEPRFDLVFVGRFVEPKAPLLAATVLARLAAIGLRCAMAGGGPLLPACEALLARSPGGTSVSLLGELGRPACLDLMSTSRLALMTSRWEGLPLFPIEAMALGVPVIAPAIPGLSEVVEDGETGLLLQAPAVEDYVDAVVSLLAAPARLAAMSAQAAVRVRRVFDRSASSGRYATLYDTLVRASTPTPAARAAVRP